MLPRPPRLSGSRADARPTVLLVDDHPGMLKAVSGVLAADFVVAGAATGGRQAIEMASRLQPDAIVLDVNMPDVDGFQTMYGLEEIGSQVPVVLLSTVETEGFVDQAFRSGGRGYVLKTRVATDLPHALDVVLAGRRFVPSLASLARLAAGTGHAVYLHGDGASLLDDLARLFDQALGRGEATCVIATRDVGEGLGSRLRARGWDDGPEGLARHFVVDAAEALPGLLRDGVPDPRVVAAFADRLDAFRRAAGAPSLTIFGAGCAWLHGEGHTRAAILLEGLWDAATRTLPFLTICGYPASGFSDTPADQWSGVCAAHGALCHARDL